MKPGTVGFAALTELPSEDRRVWREFLFGFAPYTVGYVGEWACALQRHMVMKRAMLAKRHVWGRAVGLMVPRWHQTLIHPPPFFLTRMTAMYACVWEEHILPAHLDLETPNKFVRAMVVSC